MKMNNQNDDMRKMNTKKSGIVEIEGLQALMKLVTWNYRKITDE